jgi:hypothetical protein
MFNVVFDVQRGVDVQCGVINVGCSTEMKMEIPLFNGLCLLAGTSHEMNLLIIDDDHHLRDRIGH